MNVCALCVASNFEARSPRFPSTDYRDAPSPVTTICCVGMWQWFHILGRHEWSKLGANYNGVIKIWKQNARKKAKRGKRQKR